MINASRISNPMRRLDVPVRWSVEVAGGVDAGDDAGEVAADSCAVVMTAPLGTRWERVPRNIDGRQREPDIRRRNGIPRYHSPHHGYNTILNLRRRLSRHRPVRALTSAGSDEPARRWRS